jgi:hypothetical protein
MKLFSSTEVITNKQKQAGVDERRINTINIEIVKKRQELQAIEIEFDRTLDRQHRQWEQEKNEKINEIQKLEAEVRALEHRKCQALLPLDEKIKEIEQLSLVLEDKSKYLERRESALDEQIEVLEERLSEVAEREQAADMVSKIQLNAQKGIDAQREQVQAQSKNFTLMLDSTLAGIQEKEQRLNIKQTQIDLKEQALNDKEKELIKIEQGFNDRERAINDKYETLQRALKYKI